MSARGKSASMLAALVTMLSALLALEIQAACPDETWLAYPAQGRPPNTPETCVKGFVLGENESGILACAEQCKSQNASVPCVWGAVQNKFLVDSFKRRIFIGLYQRDTNHPSEGWNDWANGCTSPYRHWHWHEPDNGDGVREDCAVVGQGGDERWHTYPCNDRFLCVCESPGTSTPAFLASEHVRDVLPVGEDEAGSTEREEDYEGKYNELRMVTIALVVTVIVLTVALFVTMVCLCRRIKGNQGSRLESHGLKDSDPAPASVVGASADVQ